MMNAKYKGFTNIKLAKIKRTIPNIKNKNEDIFDIFFLLLIIPAIPNIIIKNPIIYNKKLEVYKNSGKLPVRTSPKKNANNPTKTYKTQVALFSFQC